MANEAQYVTSANGPRVRPQGTSPYPPQRPMRSPLSLREGYYYPHAPAPAPHRTAPAQHYRSHYDNAADTHARAQAMAGNYFSRKPVRAPSPRRDPPPPFVNIASSPPLQTIRVVASTIPEASHNDHGPSNPTPALFQSSTRFPIHPPELSHEFHLYPTPVHGPRSFAFELQPVVNNNLDKFHYALNKHELDSSPQNYTARPGSYCEISAKNLAIAYSADEETSVPRPSINPGNPQDWEIKEQRAQMFSYDVPPPPLQTQYISRRRDQTPQFFDARERVESEGQDESRYLDAVEEQMADEQSMQWEGGEQSASDVNMSSDCLPGDSAYSPRSNQRYEERQRGRFSQREVVTSARDRVVRNMVEVKSPGTMGKLIEAARMRGYRG